MQKQKPLKNKKKSSKKFEKRNAQLKKLQKRLLKNLRATTIYKLMT